MEIVQQRPGTLAVPVSIIVVSAVAIVVTSSSAAWPLVPVGALLALAGWLHTTGDHDPTMWTAIVCWASVGIVSAASFGLVWPIPQLIGLALAAVVLHQQDLARPTWLDRGTDDRRSVGLAVASIPLTTVALVSFIASGRTDLDTATEGLSSLPLWVVPLAGIGFVVANPTVEEVLFRGVLQDMVMERTGSPATAIGAQALAFGAIHLNGVPGGPLGMVMAGGWGLVLGVVTHRTGSVRLAWIVHVFANVAIFSTVTGLALRDGIL